MLPGGCAQSAESQSQQTMSNIQAIFAGTLYTPLEEIPDGVVIVEDSRIAKVGRHGQVSIPTNAATIDHRDATVIPGMIDQHIHGAAGRDLMDATPEAVAAVGRFLARHGTTAFVATTVSAPIETIKKASRGLAEVIRAQEEPNETPEGAPSARPLGIHFEGPFLSPAKRGAHPARDLQPASVAALKEFLEAAGGTALMLTLAPELEGGIELLKFACQRGLRVGIGHSNATFDEAEVAINAGATHATHTFNAMRSFSHRDPGIVGAVLTDDRVPAEVICDGVHVDPAAVRLLVRVKGPAGVILVTDSVSGAGMPDGEYRVGDITVRLSGGVLRTAEGNLAGSTLTLDVALRNLMRVSGFDFRNCLRAVTLNPARLLGIEGRRGVIASGAEADLAVLDADYQVTQTYVRGRPAL
jgi:N-acetylglucosamine-6-phosphate deacetylase